jgi:anti-sigma B factor antagonist
MRSINPRYDAVARRGQAGARTWRHGAEQRETGTAAARNLGKTSQPVVRARPSSRQQRPPDSLRHVELKVTTRSQGDHTVISVAGEIDLYTAPRLQSELMTALTASPARLIVDMSRVDFCDSTGINVLLAAHRQARERGGELQLAGPGSATRKVLQVTGLESVFTVLDDPVRVTGQ